MVNIVNLLGPAKCPQSAVLKKAVEQLRSDGVIALPTDTLYGLACLSQNTAALKRLYRIKARDEKKPVAICVAAVKDVAKWGRVTVGEQLLSELLPGPVTLLFERSPELNVELNPGAHLVGIRIPDSWFIRQLVECCGGDPLALTSANVSGAQSTLAVNEFSDIWPHLAAVYDGGPIPEDSPFARLGSTVVDLSRPGSYRIVRPGCALKDTVATLCSYGLVDEDVEAAE